MVTLLLPILTWDLTCPLTSRFKVSCVFLAQSNKTNLLRLRSHPVVDQPPPLSGSRLVLPWTEWVEQVCPYVTQTEEKGAEGAGEPGVGGQVEATLEDRPPELYS